jgi:archaellum biogenesis ATPase FlaH
VINMGSVRKNNDIFEFYGIDKPMFTMRELAGDDIKRFVDREDHLDYFIASIRMGQKCAIFGAPGTGKTTCLLKLLNMIKDSIYADYLQFAHLIDETDKLRLHFLKNILRSLLFLITQNSRLLNKFDRDEISFEIDRLEYSIFEEQTGIQKTIFKTITKLLEKIDEPIVLFIDGLDRIGRYPWESPQWDKKVWKILELGNEITLNNKLILVFALQNKLYEQLEKAVRNEGDDSILDLINAFKKLESFDLVSARNAVKASLKYANYKGEIEYLFENGVIEIVLSVVKGNPLLFMHYLCGLTIESFLEKQCRITLALLKNYLFEIFEKMNEKKWNELVSKVSLPGQ